VRQDGDAPLGAAGAPGAVGGAAMGGAAMGALSAADPAAPALVRARASAKHERGAFALAVFERS